MEDAIRDAKVKVLQSLKAPQKSEYETLYATLRKEYSQHLPILLEELKRAEAGKKGGRP